MNSTNLKSLRKSLSFFQAKKLVPIYCASLLLVACGGSSSDSDLKTSDVGIRFSDAPVEDLESVNITVDKLIFNRSGDDIVVDTFTSEELNLIDSDTFQLNLLDFQGLESSLVLDSVELPVGDYQNLRIVIVNDAGTFVQEKGSAFTNELKVPSGELKLGGFTVSPTSSQTFVVEFGLRQAMTSNPRKNSPDRYILKPRGVRIVRLEDAANISGTVDLSTASCLATDDTSLSHTAYLYAGHDLDAALLGDVFVREADLDASEVNEASTDVDAEAPPAFDANVADNIIAPLVATSINADNGEYLFSYLNAGNYTVAISCNASEDDPTLYNGITVPSPAGLIVELTVAKNEGMTCNFTEGLEVEACFVSVPDTE
jgi:hypothetical protein